MVLMIEEMSPKLPVEARKHKAEQRETVLHVIKSRRLFQCHPSMADRVAASKKQRAAGEVDRHEGAPVSLLAKELAATSISIQGGA